MKHRINSLLLLFFLCFTLPHCSTSLKTTQDNLSSEIHSPLLERLYSTDVYTVFYDRAIKQCVLLALLKVQSQNALEASIGVQTFACKPEELKKVAAEHPYPEDKSGIKIF